MNIRNESSTDLTQRLIIEIAKKDYEEQVENTLKKQRQKAAIPGFRVGNAPMGMIRKMYYKGILFDHLNRTVDEQLFGYLNNNNINFLLEPLPVEEKTEADLDNQEDFTFTFEYALRPEINLEWNQLPAVRRFTIKASDKEIDEYVIQLRKRHGKYTNPENIDFEDDFISINYGEDKKGHFHSNTLNNDGKTILKDKKLGDEFKISFASIFNTLQDLAKFLKIEEKDIEEGNSYTYSSTLDSIGRVELADFDNEFFQKAFPDGKVNDEKSLRNLAAEDIEKRWAEESSKIFINDAIAVLLDNVAITLPDDFIKRYVLMTQKNMSPENLDEQYPEMVKSFKWQLIESKLSEEDNLIVTQDEIKDYVRNFFIANYFSQFNLEDVKERLDELVNDALKNNEDKKRIYDTLFDRKVEALLASKMKLDEHSGDFESFITELKKEDISAPKKKTAKKSVKKESEVDKSKEEITEKESKKKTSTKKTTKKEE